MKTIKRKDINELFKNELTCLTEALNNSKNLYHTFTLGTIHRNQCETRTVVLRNVKTNPLKIYFNADYRSPKVKQIFANSNCSALFYNVSRRVQLRFKAEAKIYHKDEISKSIWLETPLQSRKCYMGDFNPSQSLENWNPNIPLKYLKTDPKKKESELGFKNFCHIELKVLETDLLKLYHDGHIRIKIDRKNKIEFIAP